MAPQIGNLRGVLPHPYIRCDRGTDWGNPFIMQKATEEERNRVCDLFEKYAVWRLTVDPQWLAPLKGQNLACWCSPMRCHTETLLRLANKEDK